MRSCSFEGLVIFSEILNISVARDAKTFEESGKRDNGQLSEGNNMRTRDSIDDKAKAQFESRLRRRMGVLLQMMYQHPHELVDLESGEKYICTVCDMEFKRCEVEPDYRCEPARKEETELKEIELALRRLRNGTFGYCMSCSSFIGIKALEDSPTRTYCDGCAKKN